MIANEDMPDVMEALAEYIDGNDLNGFCRAYMNGMTRLTMPARTAAAPSSARCGAGRSTLTEMGGRADDTGGHRPR